MPDYKVFDELHNRMPVSQALLARAFRELNMTIEQQTRLQVGERSAVFSVTTRAGEFIAKMHPNEESLRREAAIMQHCLAQGIAVARVEHVTPDDGLTILIQQKVPGIALNERPWPNEPPGCDLPARHWRPFMRSSGTRRCPPFGP